MGAVMNRLQLMILFAFGVSVIPGVSDAALSGNAAVDHSVYAKLLSRYVQNSKVDYAGFKSDEHELDSYLETLAQIDPDKLETNEQFAFYINLYNARTIKLILIRYPDLQSIKDLGSLLQSPWKKPIVKLKGQLVTLDHIEHDILRPRFRDPRVHFAINCASKSCPPLLNEPYSGVTLDRQLDHVTRAFINDPARNYLKGKTLFVSRIFKWFADDFNSDIIGFFRKYARDGLAGQLKDNSASLKVKYLEYDWSLNSTK
jgi:hypothetical protein